MKTIKFSLVIALLYLIGACGGGGDEKSGGDNGGTVATTVTGRLIDDPVQGIDYSCSSGTSGLTNADGEYVCNVGDDVTFSIGPLTIGTVAAQSSFITPYSFFPNDTSAAINLARLLQSVDADGDANNGVITIDAAQASQLPAGTNFTDANFVSDIEIALGTTLINSETAAAHLNDAIILFGGSIPDGGHIPVAHAGPDRTVTVNQTAILDGTLSSDADGDLLTFSWGLVARPSGSGGTLFTGINTFSPFLTPDTVGDYVLQLIVNDGVVNSAADTVTVTAIAQPGSGSTAPVRDWVLEERVETSGGQDGGMAIDRHDNIYLAGESLIPFNGDANAGFQDILVVKYDHDGNRLWSTQTGTASSDLVEGIALDESNDALFVTGHTTLALHGQTVIGDRDLFLIKYDMDGNRVWTVMDGTAQEDRAMDIALDSAGNVYLTGWTQGNFDGITPTSADFDIFVAKYSTDGVNLWKRQLQGNAREWGWAIAVDAADNIYVTGYTGSDQLDGQSFAGVNDAYLAKYDSEGTRQWTRLLGSTESAFSNGIATDSANNIYICGQVFGNLGSIQNPGDTNQFIAKFNTNGALIWSNLSGGPNLDFCHGIALNSSGQIYTVGGTRLLSPDISGDFQADYTFTMFDTAGQEVWSLQDGAPYGSTPLDIGYFLALDSAENLFINGITFGSFLSNSSPNSNKLFIAKYGNAIPTGGPYIVGGNVSGALGGFILINNGGDNLEINDNGSFEFDTRLPDGASYDVQVLQGSDTSQGQACSIVSGGSNGDGSGVIDGADVTDIEVSCVGV